MLKRLNFVSVVLAFVFLVGFVYAEAYNSSDVPIQDPSDANWWTISTCSQLQNINESGESTSRNYKLINDIDCSDTASWNWDEASQVYEGFKPIGYCGPNNECEDDDPSYFFTGNFNGNGFVISNLYINRSEEDGVGLFMVVFQSNITNVGLVGVSVTGHSVVGSIASNAVMSVVSDSYVTGNIDGFSSEVGGLFGISFESSISNSHFTGNVDSWSGGGNVGGFASYLCGGVVSDSSFNGRVSGASYLGGFFGVADNYAVINNSHSIGNVTGYGIVGGFGGQITDEVNISNSYYIGEVSGVGGMIGGLVGRVENGLVENSYAVANVSGNVDIGGLVGYLWSGGHISNSHATGNINGSDFIGGLVGRSYFGSIFDSYSTGDVIGIEYAGGLVGDIDGSLLNNTYSTGKASGKNCIGGLVGRILNGGIISNSYSTGNVNGSENHTGGLVGYLEESSMLNSYSTGEVIGSLAVGGLVGTSVVGNISTSYSIGKVNGVFDVGGFVGKAEGTITDSYWNVETSGISDACGNTCNGVTGKTIEEMKNISTFTDWEISSVKREMDGYADYDYIWNIVDASDYPFLSWQYKERFDFSSPIVYLFWVENSTSKSRKFTFNVSDESEIENCSVYVTVIL